MFSVNKKRVLYTLFMSVLILSFLSGCKQKEEITENPSDNLASSDTDANDSESDVDDSDNQDAIETEPDLDQEEPLKELIVYYGDENAERIVSHKVEVDDLTPDIIIEQLEIVNVLPEGVEVLAFEEQKENGSYALRIDFSGEFQTQLFQMGTSGEYIIINSVVNTFLDAYDADKVRITVEGMVLESGHAVYDDYLFFHETD
jgi:hypothetical protein